jgi:hypothetical protein
MAIPCHTPIALSLHLQFLQVADFFHSDFSHEAATVFTIYSYDRLTLMKAVPLIKA